MTDLARGLGVGWGVASVTPLPYVVMSVAPCRKWVKDAVASIINY